MIFVRNVLTIKLYGSIINSQLKGVLENDPAETNFFRTQEPDLDNASVGNVYSLL